ncbi:MAG: metal-dependent transcriptional regulator [Bacteroidia bacterium]|nr:metal-dependent transcriptional regulator [Bacteroidia bacterium]
MRCKDQALSVTEENYLKGIYKLSFFETGKVSNNSIASLLNVNPASVLEMLRKLEKKKLIIYDKVKGARLTASGKQIAVYTIRKHRLWEVFLAEKLGFGWEEIHNIAEQMEHIQSAELVERLDKFLNFPKFDPHGDPIPDPQGRFNLQEGISLADAQLGKEYKITGVKDHQDEFLKFLSRSGLGLGIKIKVAGIEAYDDSLRVSIEGKKEITISRKVAQNLVVKKIQR